MSNELSRVEAAAVITIKRFLLAKSQLARLMAYEAEKGSVSLDWLIEKGYITVRISNPTTQGFRGEPMPYVTKTGKAWFHASPGPGVALLTLTKPWKE